MPSKRNKMRQENEKRGKERKRKVKVKILLHMPELCKLIFYIWIRRPQSV